MEKQEPTLGHERLSFLCGRWTGQEKIYPSIWDPKGGAATGHVASRMDLDGFFVISDYAQEREGIISHRGHGVYGYDPVALEYTLTWFDNMGGGAHLAPARGIFVEEALVLQQSGPFGHSRYTYARSGSEKYSMLLEISTDAEVWSPFLEGAYVRRRVD